MVVSVLVVVVVVLAAVEMVAFILFDVVIIVEIVLIVVTKVVFLLNMFVIPFNVCNSTTFTIKNTKSTTSCIIQNLGLILAI